MHYVQAKSILSAQNGMNLYRGCTHGCIYCDSRSECYGFTHDFEDVEIKQNAPELLEVALRRKRARCMIGTGSMCDPYLPLEKTERLTRRCLEIIDRYGFGAAVLTKSDLVLRDIDLFQSIHRKAKCVVQMTLTTCDEALCRVLEPNVATTRRRVEALLELKKAGIPTVVWLTPLLPFVNDTEANVRGLLAYCEEADVKGILTFGAGMTLRNGDREYYYQKLDEYFPGLKQRYIQTYGNAYELQSPDAPRLHGLMREFCAERGVLFGAEPVFAYLSTLEPKAEQTTFL
ncbi:MAG TPA: radical SAM protein [Candidatus Limiplasma sp.]|nr:radical SAM protein [Candidatus Limiplasma sp.]